MSQLVLLHGDHASSQDHWFPYIAQEFKNKDVCEEFPLLVKLIND